MSQEDAVSPLAAGDVQRHFSRGECRQEFHPFRQESRWGQPHLVLVVGVTLVPFYPVRFHMVLFWVESNHLGLMITGVMVGQSMRFVKSNYTHTTDDMSQLSLR
jgi:hypothetical protein